MIKNSNGNARMAAFKSLMLCERDNKYSNIEVDAAIRRFGLEGAERGLYTALVYGVIERRITLDYLIDLLSSKKVGALDAQVAVLLRLGLYQLIWMNRIPESAAVNETVNLAKKFTPRAASLVNAVLRNFLRTIDKNKLPYPDKKDYRRYLSVRYSCAEDVIDIIADSVADSEALLDAFEHHPEATLRVNTLKISRDEMLDKLIQMGVEAKPCRFSPFGINLAEGASWGSISELIENGYVYIQDEASQLAVHFAGVGEGSTVIDTCACPGGKSFSAAICMGNSGKVLSFDLHKSKLSLVELGAKKLGISIITTDVKNGAVRDSALVEAADTVICDVPCSGLGVIAKKPEIRYKSRDEIERLPDIQYSILANASEYVKHGGSLCYSTCTINRLENECVVNRFLAEHSEFVLEDFTEGEISSSGGMLTLLPHIHGTDGFFIAKLRKK